MKISSNQFKKPDPLQRDKNYKRIYDFLKLLLTQGESILSYFLRGNTFIKQKYVHYRKIISEHVHNLSESNPEKSINFL